MSADLPVTVVGGYLGAGKTTLVNHLLRHADGLRLAVMVNDFGDLPIDSDLIEAREDDLITIAGGCVCCSFGSDLVEAMARLATREPRPDHVLIETSGVALPGPVAGTVSLIPGFSIDCVAVLADASSIRRRASDRYLSDTILRQLADAQIVLMSKTDLVSAQDADETLSWLNERAPQARCLPIREGVLDPGVLIGTRLGFRAGRSLRAGSPAAALYASETFALPGARDLERLRQVFSRPETGVLRAKGFVEDADGRLVSLQVSGVAVRIEPHDRRPAVTGAVTVIGLRRELDLTALRDALALTEHSAG